MIDPALKSAIAQVPPGKWVVGVSGGADSVALLSLLRDRADLQLKVAHLDHETRGQASTDDAAFVADLARQWNLPIVVQRRSEIEPHLYDPPPSNPSALYRVCRLQMFEVTVHCFDAHGVILAHHADDQAETVLHRLIRGSPATALPGMSRDTEIGGLRIFRPMLGVRRDALRQVLADRGQAFREDASNASDDYLRNRLRKLLATRPMLFACLIELAESCASFREWVSANAPKLPLALRFQADELGRVPPVLAREAARKWLTVNCVPPAELSTAVLDRFVLFCTDASTPSRMQLPGNITVRRRRGVVERVDIDTMRAP